MSNECNQLNGENLVNYLRNENKTMENQIEGLITEKEDLMDVIEKQSKDIEKLKPYQEKYKMVDAMGTQLHEKYTLLEEENEKLRQTIKTLSKLI